MTWICPICGCNAYQRYGGVNLPAVKIYVDEITGEEKRQSTSLRLGTHFMCKGCSVFFGNPNLFNRETMNENMDVLVGNDNCG